MTHPGKERAEHPDLQAGHAGVVVSHLLDHDGTPASSPGPLTETVDGLLQLTAELARRLIGTHQSAAALIVEGDWFSMRKYFSLSARYVPWSAYRLPAVGFGIHADMVKRKVPIRLTQAELEAYPDWREFAGERDQYPPLRGWLAAPCSGPMATITGCCSSRTNMTIRTLPRWTKQSWFSSPS